MPFEKGVVYNPNGARKKERRFEFALLRCLKDRYGDDAKGLAKCAEAMLDIVEDKNHPQRLKAITEIRDTIDGKPKQSVDMQVSQTPRANVYPIDSGVIDNEPQPRLSVAPQAMAGVYESRH